MTLRPAVAVPMADSVGAAPGARIPNLAASTRPDPVRILAAHMMKFCSQCAAPLQLRVPEGDHLPRYVCAACGTIHYQNPQLVVGCVPEHDGRILLCRRAIEPRRGYWTVPAGFMENGETLQEAPRASRRRRRSREVRIGSLLAVVHVLHADQVHVFFRAELPQADFGIGAGEPGGRAGRGGGHSLGGHRLPQHRFHPAPLPRGPGRRPRGPPFHDHRPASGAACAGLIDAPRVARGTMPRLPSWLEEP